MTKNLIHACFKGWLLQHTAPYWGMIFRKFFGKWFPFVNNLPNNEKISFLSWLIREIFYILIEDVWFFEWIILDFILIQQCCMQWEMSVLAAGLVCFGWKFNTEMWAMELHMCINLPSICQKIKATHSPQPFLALFG